MAASGSSGKAAMKRWDAVKGTCEPWSGSGRDSDLWVRDGNCLIYLRAKDRARRAPSFRLPFSALLDAKCFPLIERYLLLDGHRPRTAEEIGRWYRGHSRQTLELLIPPCASSSRSSGGGVEGEGEGEGEGEESSSSSSSPSSTAQYLAVRNFVAWVLKKPLVGEYLGSAYIALLTSMYELRSGVKDNVHDMMGFLKGRGLLSMVNRPDYAAAALVFAETFRLRELYLLAFAHCVGMSAKLALSAEYQTISPASKELLSQARQDLNARMEKVTAILGNFADDELSEAHLGIPSGVRAHLERFRSFLLSFYSSKLGYYPPRVFDAGVLRTLADDFCALYRLLQDEGYTSFDTIPSAAVGGICTLQLVQSLDARHAFDPLPHPLPLLPQVAPPAASRRLSWLVKERQDGRQVEHAALVKASNWDEGAFGNDLVRAYRRYEGDLVLKPVKTDKAERASLADARKVRWLLVYAIHQALRHAHRRAPEVRDERGAPYLLAAPVDDALPWKEEQSKTRRSALGRELEKAARVQTQCSDMAPARIEIVPDIDYFALTHRQRGDSIVSTLSEQVHPDPLRANAVRRSNSISHVLGRNSTIRRSVLVLGYGSSSPTDDPDARIPLDNASGRWAGSRSGSTASSSSSAAALGLTTSPAHSLASSIITTPSPTSPGIEALAPPPAYSLEAGPKPRAPLMSKFNPSFNKALPATALEGYTVAGGDLALRRRSSNSAAAQQQLQQEQQQQQQQKQHGSRLLPHAFLDGKPVRGTEVWEHYTDLGGLTELA
ncbi:hypothetical protein CDD81_4014 [Ophiocordyceps australis]|uniref:DUF8004 domain-containing protein n=1 Tax=Ophiocordyceps australis TaxID=1399860 RepID=A0A2C5YBX2_9HYPO|nr:hypothetical protein CDD81_4014 [Ophiocordyceps australis]